MANERPYGSCPKCGAAGVSCERSPNGNTKCENGHSYPHAERVYPEPVGQPVSEDLLVPREKTTPPLPPGCEWERKHDAGGWYWWTRGPLPVLREDERMARHLLACYMRCAWLDESRRLASQPPQGSEVPGADLDAFHASEAWAAWGKQA